MSGRIQVKIVGHETVAAAGHLLLLDYRMPSARELQDPTIRRTSGGNNREEPRLGRCFASTSTSANANAVCRMRRASPAIAERSSTNNAALNLDDLFLSIENFRFVFFQFRSGEALGVHQRLLALIIGGHKMQIGFRDLEIVAEDGIELHFERANSGALPLALFDLRKKLFAVAAQVAELIQFLIDAGSNHAAVAER